MANSYKGLPIRSQPFAPITSTSSSEMPWAATVEGTRPWGFVYKKSLVSYQITLDYDTICS